MAFEWLKDVGTFLNNNKEGLASFGQFASPNVQVGGSIMSNNRQRDMFKAEEAWKNKLLGLQTEQRDYERGLAANNVKIMEDATQVFRDDNKRKKRYDDPVGGLTMAQPGMAYMPQQIPSYTM